MISLGPLASPRFDPKLGVHSADDSLRFTYGDGVFGPKPEFRRLDDIRASLRDRECQGPDPVYSIVMDVGRQEHREELERRMLLFGVVVYTGGQLGDEPVGARAMSMPSRPTAGGQRRSCSKFGRGAQLSTRKRAPAMILAAVLQYRLTPETR